MTAQSVRRNYLVGPTLLVAINLLWNTILVTAIIVIVFLSPDETEKDIGLLRFWLSGYGALCLIHMFCVALEYSTHSTRGMTSWPSSVYGFGSDLNSTLNSSSSGDEDDCSEEIELEKQGWREDIQDNVPSTISLQIHPHEDFFAQFVQGSVAMYLDGINVGLSLVWWMWGLIWFSIGGLPTSHDAPKLLWLGITIFTIDVLTVVISITVLHITRKTVFFCLPCTIAILYAWADQVRAAKANIEFLSKIGDHEKVSGESNTDLPVEQFPSKKDARCVVCLSEYVDGDELLKIPNPGCGHFHSTCAIKWLLTHEANLQNRNKSSEEV